MAEEEKKKCFIIMPISDPEGYEEGHFRRVYEHIIMPACDAAGYIPKRADDVRRANVIIVDILRDILESEMAICDLSSRNPNVMFELGIRQAFDKPIVLIRDSRTSRVFDTSALRDLEYDPSLRIDRVAEAVDKLHQAIRDTDSQRPNDVTSLIQLLNVKPAALSAQTSLSPETTLILNEVRSLASRLTNLEDSVVAVAAQKYAGEMAADSLAHEPQMALSIRDMERLYQLRRKYLLNRAFRENREQSDQNTGA